VTDTQDTASMTEPACPYCGLSSWTERCRTHGGVHWTCHGCADCFKAEEK
jgi:transposase-like protein